MPSDSKCALQECRHISAVQFIRRDEPQFHLVAIVGIGSQRARRPELGHAAQVETRPSAR